MTKRIIRSFVEVIGLLSRGRFADRLDEEMNAAITTLENLPDEKGSATITVEITLNYQGGRLDVRPKVKSKLPEGKAFSDTPFWTDEGGLSVQHPSQSDIFGGPRVAGEDGGTRKAQA